MDLGPVRQLLETEMDRKEFLAYIGAALLAVVGVSGLTKTLLSPTDTKTKQTKGYGSSGYGNT